MLAVIRAVTCPVSDNDFNQAAQACLHVQGITAPCLVSLTLTDDAGIQEVNRAWRGLNHPTDVLSFPAQECTPGNLFDPGSAEALMSWDSEAGAFFLGDILISVPAALRQAKEFGHSARRELCYLFVHGMFHLMGYDHFSKEDQSAMRDKEEQALSAMPARISDAELLQAARDARANAHTPYSKYRVGAALLARDGSVFTGCNIENASYGLTNCAERTAIFKAVSEGVNNFDTIAIAADQTAPWPCGACRQVMSEFAPKLRVLITWADGRTAESTLDQLLPHSFLEFQEDQHG